MPAYLHGTIFAMNAKLQRKKHTQIITYVWFDDMSFDIVVIDSSAEAAVVKERSCESPLLEVSLRRTQSVWGFREGKVMCFEMIIILNYRVYKKLF